MVTAAQPASPPPYVFVPRTARPQLLFVLLHGESAQPDQLFALSDAIKQAFPSAVVVIPYAFESAERAGMSGYFWIDPLTSGQMRTAAQEAEHRARRMNQAVSRLAAMVRRLQQQYGITGQQTALAGFSQGASMALEAAHAEPDLAGRILAFSGLYARRPAAVPPATVLHFFHGANDQQVSVDEVESTLARLGELQADATLDVASGIGHELHDALIRQAIVRLQTCVPLRSWEEALSALESDLRNEAQSRNGTNHQLH